MDTYFYNWEHKQIKENLKKMQEKENNDIYGILEDQANLLVSISKQVDYLTDRVEYLENKTKKNSKRIKKIYGTLFKVEGFNSDSSEDKE